MEIAEDLSHTKVLKIHLKVLAQPRQFSIDQIIDSARKVYASVGIHIDIVSID
jgi:hypothetical protein